MSDRRNELVAATVQLFAVANARRNHGRVAAIIGCTSDFVTKVTRGEKKVPDGVMGRLADGLRDHALRCERLADMIEEEVETRPTPVRGTGPRAPDGRFEARA